METHIITITYRDCAAAYGLSEKDLREFVDLGLVQQAEAPDTIRDEPEHLARLARLQHELGINKEGIDIILAMRRRLLYLQQALNQQQARTTQLERYLRGSGPTVEADDWLF
ncbi:MAG TPA: chaperone modulator CbpM [Hymenobacter sp.]|jgi:chaperone modulatory protein CbpM